MSGLTDTRLGADRSLILSPTGGVSLFLAETYIGAKPRDLNTPHFNIIVIITKPQLYSPFSLYVELNPLESSESDNS